MKHAICILCHTYPEKINRIIKAFPQELFDFYIQVDIKSDITPLINKQDNVFFVSDDRRVDVKWGRSSMIFAMVNLFTFFDVTKYKYVHLISEQCFPAMDPRRMYEELKDSDKQFVSSDPLPRIGVWVWGGLERIQVWYPDWMLQRPIGTIQGKIRVKYRAIVMRTKIFKRKFYPVKQFYGGSQWFSVTGECMKWMNDYIAKNPRYLRFFKHTFCGDEIFYNTLVRMSPYEDKVINDCRRFISWEKAKNGGPDIMGFEDIPEIVSSGKFFVRKVCDLELCDALEAAFTSSERA